MPESDKLTLEITQALIQKREYFALKETLATSLAPDIVEIIQFLDISDRVILFRLLNKETAAEVFSLLGRSSKRWTRTISPGSSMNFPMKW
jgi:Mg/Co/Ni transporter MgtE